MGNDFRILGRDITLRLTQGGTLLSETTAIKSATFKPVITLLSEGFLGETAKRHREIFDEVDVGFTCEPEGTQIFQMQYAVYQRARTGQAPATTQINLSFRLAFPSGAIFKLSVPDLKFADLGALGFGSREAFAEMSFAAKSDRYLPLF
jgi:hypothetical protein